MPAVPGTLPGAPRNLPGTPANLPGAPPDLPGMPGDSPGTRGVLGGTPAILLGAPGKLPRRPPVLRGTPGNSVRVPAKSAEVPGDLPGAPANLPEARPGKPRFSRFFPKNYPNRLQTSAARRECRDASANPFNLCWTWVCAGPRVVSRKWIGNKYSVLISFRRLCHARTIQTGLAMGVRSF